MALSRARVNLLSTTTVVDFGYELRGLSGGHDPGHRAHWYARRERLAVPSRHTPTTTATTTASRSEGLHVPRLRTAPYPDFFLVGAPRCATTLAYQALRGHPEIFMPAMKEPHFFSNDLDAGTHLDGRFFIRDPEVYLALFADARGDQMVGEADVLNLFSPGAARRIHGVRPDARILIQLREPVGHMHSFHSVRFLHGFEGLSFADAIGAVEDRRNGRRLPFLARNVRMYDYFAVARFSEQVERYLDVFGRERLHIVLLDDFRADAPATFAEILQFLGVDDSYHPHLSPVNEQRSIVNTRLYHLARWPPLVQRAKRVVPRRLHRSVRNTVHRLGRWDRPSDPPPAMDAELRRRLRGQFEPEVRRLGSLLGRDLITLWGYDTDA